MSKYRLGDCLRSLTDQMTYRTSNNEFRLYPAGDPWVISATYTGASLGEVYTLLHMSGATLAAISQYIDEHFVALE